MREVKHIQLVHQSFFCIYASTTSVIRPYRVMDKLFKQILCEMTNRESDNYPDSKNYPGHLSPPNNSITVKDDVKQYMG